MIDNWEDIKIDKPYCNGEYLCYITAINHTRNNPFFKILHWDGEQFQGETSEYGYRDDRYTVHYWQELEVPSKIKEEVVEATA